MLGPQLVSPGYIFIVMPLKPSVGHDLQETPVGGWPQGREFKTQVDVSLPR